jgi:hypothetical protein
MNPLKYLINVFADNQTPWPLVRKRTTPTEWPPLVGQAKTNFCG